MRFPCPPRLLQQPFQIGSVLTSQEVATPGQEATDPHGILRHFVAAHTAIALFDPPADGPLSCIISAIKRFSFGAFPVPIARQAMPEIPAIEKQEPQAISQTSDALFLVAAKRSHSGDASLPVPGLLPLPTLDQLA